MKLVDDSREKCVVELKDGAKIHCRIIGSGLRVAVLIHGFGENSFAWGPIPDALTSIFTVVAIDMRGHGDSTWDKSGHYELGRLVKDVVEAVQCLKLTRFLIIGHSLGASVALEVAAALPYQVERLVLVELASEPVPEGILRHARLQFLDQFREYASATDYLQLLTIQRPLADLSALKLLAENSLRPILAGKWVLKCDPFVQSLHVAQSKESLDRQKSIVAKLLCSCVFVRGSGSAIVRRTAMTKLVGLSRRTYHCTIDGAGHGVMIDQPEAFYGALIQLLH